ncbi:Bud site selection protein 6 [Mycena kentingensis (nom. inval.)]|nr:Bud site selection protein 6 [Mycena kentingensis (nom. inval.)]
MPPQWHSPQARVGDVGACVRSLLLSTKQLPDALAQWARGELTEEDVSDVYVRVGSDFNATVQAFAVHRVDLSDLHSVPNDLRAILEQTLAEDPSPAVLAASIPQLRAVLSRLLRGLQAKRSAWQRAKASAGVLKVKLEVDVPLVLPASAGPESVQDRDWGSLTGNGPAVSVFSPYVGYECIVAEDG